jgi:hypothetical protein
MPRKLQILSSLITHVRQILDETDICETCRTAGQGCDKCIMDMVAMTLRMEREKKDE